MSDPECAVCEEPIEGEPQDIMSGKAHEECISHDPDEVAMPDGGVDQSTVEKEHKVRGVGRETRVLCEPKTEAYGPHPDAENTFEYCPYCGSETDDGIHESVEGVQGELFCPTTSMSTYRYCPGCGEEVA